MSEPETTTPRPWSTSWYAERERQLGQAACHHLGFYAIPESLCLSVVIPVYNEQSTLRELVEKVREIPIRKEILLIDDHSEDGSRALVTELARAYGADEDNRVRGFFHAENRGKGAALRTGFENLSGDLVVIQDADLEYDPYDYPALLKPIIDGRADVVYGSRFLGDKAHRVLYFWHFLGNRFLTGLSNCFTNLNLTDMETCYKAFRREVIDELRPSLKQNRFGFEPEVTAKVSRRGYRVFETSISYSGRTYAEGKKIGWKDGFSALWCIVRFGFAD